MDAWDLYSVLSFVLVAQFVLRQILVWSKIFYVHVVSKIFDNTAKFVESYGPWAVVTGSSSGIGKNYAKELAKRGLNLVLISNEDEQLHAVAKEIEIEHGVQTKTIVADFSLAEDEHQRIFKSLEDIEIGILVNNVGTACGLPNKFEDMSRKQMWDLVMINVCAAASMTHHILPKMKRRGHGLVVNIASMAALSPTPYATLYGASKAFMRSFSDALRWECRGSGVQVQTICPGFVDTKIIDSHAAFFTSIFFPTPEKFAKSAVATIGKAASTAGFMPHDAQIAFLEEIPTPANTWFAKRVFMVKDFDAPEDKKED